MRDEESGTDQGSCMRGSCASVSRDTAEVEYIRRSSLYQREKCVNDIRPASRDKSQMGRTASLGTRLLCYVETVGNVNEEVIKRYISEQEESDKFEK